MNNFDADTNEFADTSESTPAEGADNVKDYQLTRVVVNPEVFASLRSGSLADPIKRERWLITRLGESPSTGNASLVPNTVPIFMPKGAN